MKPIYIPKGAAKEYGDYAINIYTGCPHRCYCCFAPSVLRRDREAFHSNVAHRPGIVEAVKRQLDKEQITDKLIHLCFICDPYPKGFKSTATREIIQALKSAGNHVQILTKNGAEAMRDFDLLDDKDWFGVTYAGYNAADVWQMPTEEPGASSPALRLRALSIAYRCGIKTWVSIEPVLNALDVLTLLELAPTYIDKYKIGKLNYHPSYINWREFGVRVEQICRANKLDYYIKDSLRREMQVVANET